MLLPSVTFCVSVYNKAYALPRTLPNILQVARASQELLFYDDASTDASVEILTQTVGSLGRILRGEINGGHAYAVNRLVEAAQSEVVVFQDADDLSHIQRIPLMLDALLHTRRAWVLCRKAPLSRMSATACSNPLPGRVPLRPWHGTMCGLMCWRTAFIPWIEELRQYEEVLGRWDMIYRYGLPPVLRPPLYWYDDSVGPYHLGAARHGEIRATYLRRARELARLQDVRLGPRCLDWSPPKGNFL